MVPETPGRARPIVLLLMISLLAAGCTTPTPAPPDGNDTPPEDPATPPGTGQGLPSADGQVLMDLVEAQVYDGAGEPVYRIPGTAGHAATIPVLEAMLADRGLWVRSEVHQARLPELGKVNLTNVHGIRNGTSDQEIWLAAHWDSRAWADGNTGGDCQGVGQPVLGANDGAAAVAVVTHALDLLAETDHTIRVVLFDGEDQGCGGQGWAVGSEAAARSLNRSQLDKIQALILVDMPGAENLTIRREGHSVSSARPLVDRVFGVAGRLGASAFVNTSGPAILDDHVAFLERTVPAVDLIHLDHDPRRGVFPWTHHTVHDTPANLSPDSMAQVTEVVVASVLHLDGQPVGSTAS